MSFETAQRATELLLALALIQHSAEHLISRDRNLFATRIGLCLLLLAGLQTQIALVGLCGLSLAMLHRFQGPYNGGSDRMAHLITWALAASYLAPSPILQQTAFAYLAAQLILSYVISGWVKLVNPDWRKGQALCDVFAFSAYPVSEGLRRLADRRALLRGGSWLVIGFEVAFPLALLTQPTLFAALFIGAGFHLANACLFGLNRFFWIWLAAYPSLIWLQDRLF